MAIIKSKGAARQKGNYIPVEVLNTLNKIVDKAMMREYKDYMRDLLLRKLGVGVKFAAKLLSMGI